MNTETITNKTYSISLQDKQRRYKSEITEYDVREDVARKLYFQFFQLWGKKVTIQTAEGITVEGYLNKVNGQFDTN